MKLFFAKHGVTLFWSLMIGVLLGGVGLETDWGRQLRRPVMVPSLAAGNSGEGDVSPLFSLPALDVAYKETAERPLFVPARRPPPPPPPATAEPPPRPAMRRGQFKLLGTIVNKDISLAYLKEIASNRTLRVDKGSEVNGMKLETVDATRVVLKLGDDTEELQLKSSGSPKSPVNPAGQMPPAPAMPGQPAPDMETPATGNQNDPNAPNRRRRFQNLIQSQPQQ